jgi:hypothetical protein
MQKTISLFAIRGDIIDAGKWLENLCRLPVTELADFVV